MKPSVALQLHRKEIRYIVKQHHAKNARVFGSVLSGEDTESTSKVASCFCRCFDS